MNGNPKNTFSNLKRLTQLLEKDENPSHRTETILLLKIVNYRVDAEVDVKIMHHLDHFLTRILSKENTKDAEEKMLTTLQGLDKVFLNHYGRLGRWK